MPYSYYTGHLSIGFISIVVVCSTAATTTNEEEVKKPNECMNKQTNRNKAEAFKNSI